MGELRRQHRRATRKTSRFTAALPSTSRRPFIRQFFGKLMTFGAMAGVGALLVSTSLPANAFQSAGVDEVVAATAVEAQSVTVQNSAAATAISRDEYTVVKPAPKPQFVAVTAVFGSYSNNPNSPVQWPLPSSPITSGFGMRSGGMHAGLDFTPGEGTPIGVIADGVVVGVSTGGTAYGNSVTVSHVINGQEVRSLYAHMQYGSIGVAVGQAVTVGTYVGAVGNTGRSYGAHLHLEIHVGGAAVDPYAWLTANVVA